MRASGPFRLALVTSLMGVASAAEFSIPGDALRLRCTVAVVSLALVIWPELSLRYFARVVLLVAAGTCALLLPRAVAGATAVLVLTGFRHSASQGPVKSARFAVAALACVQ